MFLLGEPDLVASKEPGVEQSHIVRVHNQLRTVRICLSTVKQLNQAAHEQRMQTVVDLVNHQYLATLQCQDDRSGDAKEALGPQGLILAWELDIAFCCLRSRMAHSD